ncbi:MAG: NfeD family protein [Phycisphaerales bacterium]
MGDEALLFWGLGLIAASLLLIVVEVFVPSGGLISLAATGCAIGGAYCLFRHDTVWGIIGLSILVVLGPAVFSFALKVWPSTPIGRKMLGEKPAEQVEAERLAGERERDKYLAMIGQEGVVVSDLRPIGTVQIGGKRYDALSEAGFVRAGSRVRVTLAEPSQIKVRAGG